MKPLHCALNIACLCFIIKFYMPDFFANKAGVLLEGGNSLFVGNAAGYIRLNLAMPRSIIKTGLDRMTDAIEKHNSK